jgi:putative hydrolase of the HAD superfamily
MAELKVIAWDFDGVLNRNIVDGRFLWADTFEADLGQSLASFQQHVFGGDFDDVITGRVDLRDRVASWTDSVGFAAGPDAVLDYWFAKDSLPDPAMLGLMRTAAQHGLRQVIATNNEARRARYIEHEMGYGARVERIFASGRIGVRKPDLAYFRHISDYLQVDPACILLIDDVEENVHQAAASGWKSFLFDEDSRGRLEHYLAEQLPAV